MGTTCRSGRWLSSWAARRGDPVPTVEAAGRLAQGEPVASAERVERILPLRHRGEGNPLGRGGGQVLVGMHDDVDPALQQRGPDPGHEHAGATDDGQRSGVHVALGPDADELDRAAGDPGDPIGHHAGLGQGQGAAPGADPQNAGTHRDVAPTPEMPDAANRSEPTATPCQSAAESTAAVVGRVTRAFTQQPAAQKSGRRVTPANFGEPGGGVCGGQPLPDQRGQVGDEPRIGPRGADPGEEQPGLLRGFRGLPIQVPDHLDMVGDEPDRHDDDAAPPGSGERGDDIVDVGVEPRHRRWTGPGLVRQLPGRRRAVRPTAAATSSITAAATARC